MKTVLVIVGEQDLRSRLILGLDGHEWSVLEAAETGKALALTRAHKPELIICDWLPPFFDIALACRNLGRETETPGGGPILLATGTSDPAQKMSALESGADEFIAKPIEAESLSRFLTRVSANGQSETPPRPPPSPEMEGARVKFWGVRGSIAAPGPETVYYGGNTSCVEVRVGGDIIILDAGTGIRKLGLALVEEFQERPIHLNVLISHTHWDHIQGFPFFPPAYNLNNQVTIYGFEGARRGLEGTLSSQMESPYFPISMQQMPGAITIRELKETQFRVGQVEVKAHFLNHPGVCIGYRLFTPGGSICYLPDVELFRQYPPRPPGGIAVAAASPTAESFGADDRAALEFVRDSEVLILDSQYDAKEYDQHVGWGHSCFEDGVAFAIEAGVRRLFLFHHDPEHTDEHISRMVARARALAHRRGSPLIIEAAREGRELLLPATRARG